MDARFYNSDDIDIERLASDLVNVYVAQGYQAQQFGDKDQMLVQLKKGSDFEAILGMQAAVSLTLQHTYNGVLAMIGQQRWLDKAAVGTIGIVAFPVLWPLALTAGAGALRQASLGNQVLNMVDGLIRQQQPNIQVGPIPVQLIPQVQQRWGQPPYQQPPNYVPQYVPPQTIVSAVPTPALPAATLRCPQCNTPYEEGDTFCSGCGRSLIPPKVYCTNCNTELKSGVAFCPKCGASTFQAFAAAQRAQSGQGQPAPQAATPTVTYTAPAPPAPPPTKRDEVYYTPSVQPAAEPYTPPKPVAPPPAQPVQPVQPPRPAPQQEVRYVPPTTPAPTVTPQPTVTYTQGTPSTPPKQPTPKREEVYYVPSPQAPTVSAKAQPQQSQQPIAAKPTAQPAVDPHAQWGTLTFSDGTQVALKGERALVGRYDHDIGGVQPEVDLGQMQGADTVSRIHAAFEHVGSTYTLTDLNSTNATRINGKRLEPDKATPLQDGDTVYFGRVSGTFKKK